MHKTLEGLSSNTLDALRDFFYVQAIEEKHLGKRHVKRLDRAHVILVMAGQLFGTDNEYSSSDIVWIHDLARNIAWNVPEGQPPSPVEMNPLMLFIQGCKNIS